jgi:hypothetical protein
LDRPYRFSSDNPWLDAMTSFDRVLELTLVAAAGVGVFQERTSLRLPAPVEKPLLDVGGCGVNRFIDSTPRNGKATSK